MATTAHELNDMTNVDLESKLREAKEITGLAEFDKAKHVLKVHNRYRGPGDCGSYAVYSFTGAGAQLKEQTAYEPQSPGPR